MHQFVYDEAGRIDHVIVTRESEWSEDDASWAQALTHLDGQICKGCGQPLAETTSADYVAVVEQDTCYACRAMDVVKRDLERSHRHDGHPSPGRPAWSDGLLVWARPAEEQDLRGRVRPE